MKRNPQNIFGYVDLTPEMRQWIRNKIAAGKVNFARGWRVYPAHHRANPTSDILKFGYPDCEDSHPYIFDDPEKRDPGTMEVLQEPLPIKSQRDKDYFREENATFFEKDGFYRYKILQSRRNYIEEYVPDAYQDEVPKSGKGRNVRRGVYDDVKGEEAEKIQVQVKKKSKTETRLVNTDE